MTKAKITAARARELLRYDPETGFVYRERSLSNSTKVGQRAGYVHPTKLYRYLCVDGGYYFEHRIIWLLVHGQFPEAQIDHINGDRQDNRICNLRELNNSENAQNKKRACKGSTSGILGVSWMTRANKWRAQIQINKRVTYLGIFGTKEAAQSAYMAAKKRLHLCAT